MPHILLLCAYPDGSIPALIAQARQTQVGKAYRCSRLFLLSCTCMLTPVQLDANELHQRVRYVMLDVLSRHRIKTARLRNCRRMPVGSVALLCRYYTQRRNRETEEKDKGEGDDERGTRWHCGSSTFPITSHHVPGNTSIPGQRPEERFPKLSGTICRRVLYLYDSDMSRTPWIARHE